MAGNICNAGEHQYVLLFQHRSVDLNICRRILAKIPLILLERVTEGNLCSTEEHHRVQLFQHHSVYLNMRRRVFRKSL